MEPVAQSYLRERARALEEAGERVLAEAIIVLREGGDHRAAESLQGVLNTLDGRPCTLGEQVPGLYALLRLAAHEVCDPRGMLPGERVRLVFNDGAPSITGVWYYDDPSEEWPVGRNYVERDDDGSQLDVNGGGWMRVEPVWFNLNKRNRHESVSHAITVIASAFAEQRALREVDPGDLITHDHIDYEQPVDPQHERRNSRRFCDCGELAELRVVAWAAAPNEDIVYLRSEPYEGSSPWAKPEEYGSETVCSHACAEAWVEDFRGTTFTMLGQSASVLVRFNLEPWTYQPEFEDLPGVLAEAQEATATAAAGVRDAAVAWMEEHYEQAAVDLANVRASATIALARIAELGPVQRGPVRFTAGDPEPFLTVPVTTEAGEEWVNDPIHKLWMPNWRGGSLSAMTWTTLTNRTDVYATRGPELLPTAGGMHPRDVAHLVWLGMAAPLVIKILDDPHRYEVIDGGTIVYDRQTNWFIDGTTGLHKTG